MTRLGMLIDLKRCVGCDSCTLSCKAEQGTPPGVMFSRVNRVVTEQQEKIRGFFLPVLCNHCESPACLKACPSHAIYKTNDGIVLIDEDKCVGARACVPACPYNQSFYPENDLGYFGKTYTPYEEFHNSKRKKNISMKCNLCKHRLDKGMEPSCVTVCPSECRIFGDLDDPNGKIANYLKTRLPKGEPTPLRAEAGTKPKVLYLW